MCARRGVLILSESSLSSRKGDLLGSDKRNEDAIRRGMSHEANDAGCAASRSSGLKRVVCLLRQPYSIPALRLPTLPPAARSARVRKDCIRACNLLFQTTQATRCTPSVTVIPRPQPHAAPLASPRRPATQPSLVPAGALWTCWSDERPALTRCRLAASASRHGSQCGMLMLLPTAADRYLQSPCSRTVHLA